MLHHHPHGRRLGLEVRLEPPHFGGLALRVRQDEDARDALDRLQCKRALALQFRRRRSRRARQFGVARLRLRQPALGAGRLSGPPRPAARPISSSARWSNSVSESSTWAADALDFGEAIVACLFEERREGVLVQPVRRLRHGMRLPASRAGGSARREVPEHAGLLQAAAHRARRSPRRRAAHGSLAQAHPRPARGRNRSEPAAHAGASRTSRPC